jgi:hypothetical protein
MSLQRFKIAIAIAALCVAAFTGEFVYNRVHLESGPNGWFAVVVTINAYNAIQSDQPGYGEDVVRGPFASRAECERWFETAGRYFHDVSCKQMRFDDAARERWSGMAP